MIVVYADENYFELERLMVYIEEGRDKIATASKLGGERFQVVFGGYRATPQVEMWIVPQGGPMPEFKPDERPKAEYWIILIGSKAGRFFARLFLFRRGQCKIFT